MHDSLLLDDLIKSVLQEIGKFGLGSATFAHYRRAYGRLQEFAAQTESGFFSNRLIESFLSDIGDRHRTGAIGRGRRDHLRRASLLLREYAETQSLSWKPYTFQIRPMPTSEEFLALYASFIDNLQSCNRSRNTIQSCAYTIRQFLLFLENHGCNSIALASTAIVPRFFQRLPSTYRPTSIHVVASNMRSFLRFCEAQELLLAVPSRCLRNKPIIPILSDQEHDALKALLQRNQVSFRDKSIILLALRTGLRAIDILNIRITDIDWINNAITIPQSKTGAPFKLPLTVDVGNALSAYLLDERPDTNTPLVFVRSIAPFIPLSGHSACYTLVRRAFHRAGIRVGGERKGVHLLRHSAASRMLSKGVPISIISSLLGHADKASTEIYLATDRDRIGTRGRISFACRHLHVRCPSLAPSLHRCTPPSCR